MSLTAIRAWYPALSRHTSTVASQGLFAGQAGGAAVFAAIEIARRPDMHGVFAALPVWRIFPHPQWRWLARMFV